jgi:hypothetical protein
MTQNTYFLHLQNSTVVGFHSDDIDATLLPRGEKTIKVLTNEPSKYLGLDEKQIFLDPLPEVEHDVTDYDTLPNRRQELKRLFYEIQFTKGILEDAKHLGTSYDTKLREYNDLK